MVNAQKTSNNYVTQWKKVDTLVSKGLTKSATTEVDKIYAAAKKTNNDPQIIKALLYKVTLNQNIQEDASVKSIDTLEQEISSSKEPAKSILESIGAQMYWNYFQQHRYQLYQRTNTVNFDKKDIATWTTDDLHKKIGELYLASISNEKLLQQTKPETFDAVIIKGNVRYLRPTLYDLLAHRALDYFKNDERNITKPAYAFEIHEEEAFAPVSEFIKHRFLTKDSSSLHNKAILIFQSLLGFHESDAKPDALIDADIERISFMNQYGVMANKEDLYIDAIQNISKKYADNPVSAQASFMIAQEIYNKAQQASQQKDSTQKYSVRQSKEMLDKVIKKFPASEGGINARNLLNQILHPQLNLTTEKVNVPGLPFRTLVGYKNFNAVYFRLIELTPQLRKQLSKNYDNEKLFRALVALKSFKNWKQDISVSADYLSHSVEVKIDALPVGNYALIGSADEDFNLNKNPLAVQYFYVSDISFINSGLQYFVLNRTTGQPLAAAKVAVWDQQYDYKSQENKLVKQESLVADKHGYVKLGTAKKDENRNVRLDIYYKKDHLFLEDYQNTYAYYNNVEDDDYEDQKEYDEDRAKVFLFTDRSIYRPGQLVYFKGIGVTKNWKTKKPVLLTSKDSLTIILNDANSQKVDSIKVLLNEFGSFNGKFRLPENKLNGEFEIDVDDYENSSVSFSVEEYKRPKFYTEFDTLKASYRVGDTVSITGFAKAYAGNNVDGAKVSYRVTRVARFLYPWIFWRKGFPQTQPLEITHGEITTDADGKFTIQFAAIPDLTLDKKTDPVFDYKVEADVTDINGETRSGDITVPVGYKALNLQITLPQGDIVNIDSLKNISVTSKNLSSQPEAAKADAKIYKLQPPERLIRERLWEQPDKFILNKNEFIQYFPHDEYKDESKKESWAKGELAYSNNDSTNAMNNWQLAKGKFPQGWYVIEATAKDRYGQEVKDVKYFQVYDAKASSLPTPSYIWNFAQKNIAEPGETAKVITGTSADNVFLIEEINKQKTIDNRPQIADNAINELNFVPLNNNKKSFDFNITENDRGGFGVNNFFVKDNRFYASSNTIYVPWSNKELNISFDTYRDKTLPGSEEKWKVKISGNKGEKVAAEMLASMYDASLDQFKPHSWSALDVWPTFSGYNNWQGRQNFISVQSIEKYWNEPYLPQKEKTYDALNYLPGINYLEGRVAGLQIRGAASVARDQALAAPAEMNKANLDEVVVVGFGTTKKKDLTGSVTTVSFSPPKIVKDEEVIKPLDQSEIQVRKNFNETAFFFPELRTDKDGNIEFSFTMPEALTQWKLMTLAHTKDLASGYGTKTVITQKDLMAQPNAPRFLREGDQMEFSAKIVNLGDKEVSGQADFQL
ncbi:MAG: MG2 domain-containing protein, partial [Ginsengibacter sp.]